MILAQNNWKYSKIDRSLNIKSKIVLDKFTAQELVLGGTRGQLCFMEIFHF